MRGFVSSDPSCNNERDSPHVIDIGESKRSEYYQEVLVREILEEQTHEERCREKTCYTICLVLVFGVFIFLVLYL